MAGYNLLESPSCILRLFGGGVRQNSVRIDGFGMTSMRITVHDVMMMIILINGEK